MNIKPFPSLSHISFITRSRLAIALSLVLIVACISQYSHGARPYPKRPIANTVVWGAGGGTDSINRMLMAEMAKILGTRVTVNNRVGGVNGSIGMSYAYGRRADGYQLVGISESNVTAAVNGGWDKRFDVWYPFIFGGSPDLISVGANAKYKSFEELVTAAKDPKNEIKVAAGGSGSIHHLNLLALMNGSGAQFKFIPYAGSSPAQTAAVTGEVDVVITSVAEQVNLLRGNKLRALAVLTEEDFTIDGLATIPSALQKLPALKQYLPIEQAIGFAVNDKAPEEVKAKLAEAFEQALKTDKVSKWAKDNYYLISGAHGKEARQTFSRLESLFSWTLFELGAAKHSPEKFGIPKPKAAQEATVKTKSKPLS